MFRVSDEIDPATGLELMGLLARGAYRSEIPDFPPASWPKTWSSEHQGRYLGAASGERGGPHRYELLLPGCACRLHLVLEYGSDRAQSEVLILDHSVTCI